MQSWADGAVESARASDDPALHGRAAAMAAGAAYLNGRSPTAASCSTSGGRARRVARPGARRPARGDPLARLDRVVRRPLRAPRSRTSTRGIAVGRATGAGTSHAAHRAVGRCSRSAGPTRPRRPPTPRTRSRCSRATTSSSRGRSPACSAACARARRRASRRAARRAGDRARGRRPGRVARRHCAWGEALLAAAGPRTVAPACSPAPAGPTCRSSSARSARAGTSRSCTPSSRSGGSMPRPGGHG